MKEYLAGERMLRNKFPFFLVLFFGRLLDFVYLRRVKLIVSRR
jgi:hypothetical protein